jgi:recombination protein RecA
MGQGRENSKNFLRENPKVAWEIEDKIRAAHGLDFEMPKEEQVKDDGDDVLDE